MTTLNLTLFLGAAFYICLPLISLALRPLRLGVGKAALVIFAWSLTINFSFLCSYWDLPRWVILIVLIGVIVFGLVANRHALLRELLSLAPYSLLGMATVFIAALPLIYSFPPDAVITEFGVSNDSVHHAYLGKGFGEATKFLSALSVYPQGAHSVLWFLSWLLGLEPVFLLLPVTLVLSSLTPIALLQIGEYERHLSPGRIYIGALCTGTCFILIASCYFLYTAQCVVTPLSIALAIRSFYISRLRPAEFLLLIILAIAAVNTYSIMGLALMGVAMILNYSGWFAVAWHLLSDLAVFFKLKFFKGVSAPVFSSVSESATPAVVPGGTSKEVVGKDGFQSRGSSIVLLLLMLFSLLSVYPNFINSISKFLPYFFGQNPLGENLWAASGVMPGYIETIHILGIWPLSSDFRAALPDGTIKVIGALSLLIAGMLLSKAPRGMQGLGVVGIVLYAALSFSGTYLNFKVLALAAPLISFAVCFSLINLFPLSRKFVAYLTGGLLVTALLFSYSKSIISFHRENVVTRSSLDDLLKLKKLYVDKHNVLLLDTMDFASYIIDDQKDFSPMTQYLNRPWNGSSVDLVIVNRKNREKAKEYLAQQKVYSGLGVSLAVRRSCRVSHFKQWDVYRVCYGDVNQS